MRTDAEQIIKEQQAKLRADVAERVYNVSEPAEPVGIVAVLERLNGGRFQRLETPAMRETAPRRIWPKL